MDGIAALNNNFNLGFLIIGVFMAARVGSIIIYRYKGLDDIEATSARGSRPKILYNRLWRFPNPPALLGVIGFSKVEFMRR